MIDAPLVLYRDVVRPEWVDYNHHLNVAFYVRAFDIALHAGLPAPADKCSIIGIRKR